MSGPPDLLSVICFAISPVAENEEHHGRQRPDAERYPKPKLARSFTLPGHLCSKGYRRKKNDENENRPHVHLTVSDCHRNHNTEPALECWTSAKSEAASVGGLFQIGPNLRFSPLARRIISRRRGVWPLGPKADCLYPEFDFGSALDRLYCTVYRRGARECPQRSSKLLQL